MAKKREKQIQKSLCRYVAYQYPGAMYNVDLSGIRATIGQSVEIKRMRSKESYPDFVMYEPKGFCGLFIELKKEGERLQKRNGDWYERPGKQHETILKLRSKGFAAGFCVGLDNAIKAVDAYMNMNRTELFKSFYEPR